MHIHERKSRRYTLLPLIYKGLTSELKFINQFCCILIHPACVVHHCPRLAESLDPNKTFRLGYTTYAGDFLYSLLTSTCPFSTVANRLQALQCILKCHQHVLSGNLRSETEQRTRVVREKRQSCLYVQE